MKVKTSVTLSAELIAAIDESCAPSGNRSEFLEQAAWDVIRRREREEASSRDRQIMARNASEWNQEAAEFLDLQADVWSDEGIDASR